MISIDTSQIDKIFQSLSQEKCKEYINEGLENASEVYYKNILQSLRSKVPNADVIGIKKGYSTWRYALSTAIQKYVDTDNEKVVISGNRDPRLKWFESGTNERYTKGRKIIGKTSSKRLKRQGEGSYKGRLNATNFFHEGVTQSQETAMETLIESVIKKIKENGIDI